MKSSTLRARKRADLLSVTGAAVAGLGAGAFLSRWLAGVAVAALVAGLAAHAIGMASRHRLDTDEAGPLPPVWRALYIACWVAIVALVVVGLWHAADIGASR